VLDEVGRVISASAAAEAGLPPMMEEQAAVQQYYRARARAAVENTVPGLKFDVRVLVMPLTDPAGATGGTAFAAAQPATAAAPATGKRDFRLRVSIVTASELGAEDRGLVDNAVSAAVGLDPRAGDSLMFTVGPIDPLPAPPVGVAAAPAVSGSAAPAATAVAARSGSWSSLQTWIAVAIGILLVLIGLRARSVALPTTERDAMVERIRHQLSLTDGTRDARA
jgi:flagellar M-ring protein FliF